MNDKQCTITWYVDGLKISHIGSKAVDDSILMIGSHYDKINVSRGKTHIYIGTEIEFIRNGQVPLCQRKHLN